MNSASLCSLADRYDNPLPPPLLAPIDSLKIPALHAKKGARHISDGGDFFIIQYSSKLEQTFDMFFFFLFHLKKTKNEIQPSV
jgi:hypothetical protein